MSKIFTYANNIIEEDAKFKLDNKYIIKGILILIPKHRDIFLDSVNQS